MSEPTAQAQASATQQPAQAPSAASFVTRVALVLGGWTTLHLLVVAALTRSVVPGGWWTFLGVWLATLACMAVILSGFSEHAYPSKARRVYLHRPFWYAQVILLPTSLLGAAAWLVGLPFGRGATFGMGAALGMAALMAALCLVGYVGSRALVVKRIELQFPDLPAAFDGMTIAQLSDLHVGPHTPDGFLRRIVRKVDDAKPDMIAFTGDQVDDYDRDVARFAEVFGGLRAPLGVFAIAGNHDVYAGWPGVRRGMEAAGMRVLVNAAVPVRQGQAEIWIAGTGDPAGASTMGGIQAIDVAPDLARTLADVPPGAFVVALAHNPALFRGLAPRGVQLTLSGHTHHGQLSIPALNWSLANVFLEYAMGLYERGGSKLYINPGTNYWALPFRIGAWPEVTLLTLRRADPQAAS